MRGGPGRGWCRTTLMVSQVRAQEPRGGDLASWCTTARHGLRWSRQLPACTAWAHCAGTTTTRTLHRGVGKKSVQHRMTEPILCREWRSVHSLNNYYWSSLVRHYMKCGIKYFSLVKIFSGHTAPVRWWDGGCPGRAAARDLWWCGRRAQHSTLQPYFHHHHHHLQGAGRGRKLARPDTAAVKLN